MQARAEIAVDKASEDIIKKIAELLFKMRHEQRREGYARKGTRLSKEKDKMRTGMQAIPIHKLQEKNDVQLATTVDDNDQVKASRCKASVLVQSNDFNR